jgi:hypothetical protein
VDVGWGAAQALNQPDPGQQGAGMAGGFAGPSPQSGGAGGGAAGSAAGGGAYGGGEYGATASPTFGTVAPATIQPSNGQSRAPMWDAATPAAFATSGTGGPSGAAGSSTLFQRGASGSAGGYGVTARPATGGGGTGFSGRAQPAAGGYYGGPGMPQAMSPLQRLLQQTGVVPLNAGRAAGAPGTV